MNRSCLIVLCLLACIAAARANGHGTPIVVTATASALSASGGLADIAGFAPQMFVEDDEQGDPVGEVNIPTFGPAIRWTTPGFSISGLDNSANLSLEILSRPVLDSSPLEHRVVWYWNPQTEEVTNAISDIHLLGTGMRSATLTASSGTPPAPFLLAATLTGQQIADNHNLLSYLIENDPPLISGAYGFFARLTSNQYAPSNPFLVVFNHEVDYELMVEAALAINAAAVESLLGDYNFDGIVDTADFVVWRKSDGEQLGYDVWRQNFGSTASGAGNVQAAVPEPTSLLSASAALASLILCGTTRKTRARSTFCRANFS